VGITGIQGLHHQLRISAEKVNSTLYLQFFACLLCLSSKSNILMHAQKFRLERRNLVLRGSCQLT
jgi:hypothetical protein